MGKFSNLFQDTQPLTTTRGRFDDLFEEEPKKLTAPTFDGSPLDKTVKVASRIVKEGVKPFKGQVPFAKDVLKTAYETPRGETIAKTYLEGLTGYEPHIPELKKKYPVIGDVRGRGLMIGMELVKDSAKTPAADEANAIRKSCLEKGLLIGLGGVLANVLRIQPPLVITDDQIDESLAIIEKSLGEL